jgi:hypothetical protein
MPVLEKLETTISFSTVTIPCKMKISLGSSGYSFEEKKGKKNAKITLVLSEGRCSGATGDMGPWKRDSKIGTRLDDSDERAQ